MFSESHETTRNVGMMGVVLGLLVVGGLYGLGAVFLTGMGILEDDEPSMRVWVDRLEDQIESGEAELEKEQATLMKLEGYQEVIVEIEKKKEQLKGELEGRLVEQEEVEVLEEDYESVELAFTKYRDQYRDSERSLAKGEQIDLSSTHGEGFEACKIMGVSPLHLRVMTSTGLTGIEYQKLPQSLQDRFQFGEEEAAAYREWLKVAGARNEKRMAAFREKQKAKRAEEAIVYRQKAMSELTVKIEQLTNQAQKLEAEAKAWDAKASKFKQEADAARRAGRITSRYGLASQARRKATGYRTRGKSALNMARVAQQKLLKLKKEAAE